MSRGKSSHTKVWLSVSLIGLIIVLFLGWWIYFKEQGTSSAWWLLQLPYLNCSLNMLTAFFLVLGYYFIKSKNIKMHKLMMLSALGSSALFLVSYLIYHHYVGDTKFQGVGFIRPIYFFILISHIILSVIQIPLILATFFFAFTNRVESHRKVAVITFPVWLYVSVTGVLVFIFLKLFSH